jgi:outer membrane protein TolC
MNERSTRRLAGAVVAFGLAAPGLGGDVAPPPAPPLTLRRAMELAASQSPEVVAASAAEAEAAAARRVASATPRPELWVSTGPGYAAGVPGPLLGGLPAIARVDLRASLFDPARRAGEEEARARLARAGGVAASARVAAARAAGELFSRCVLDASLAEAAAVRLSARERARARTEALAQEGRVTAVDVGHARLAEAEARQDLAEARADRELDEAALRVRVGWPAGSPLVLAAASVADLPEEGGGEPIAAALAADPEVQGLASAAWGLEKAARWQGRRFVPVVEAAAQYARLYKTSDWDLYYPTFQPDNWAVGASISIPLWTAGRVAAQEATTRARLDRVKAERRARERDLQDALERAAEAVNRTAGRRELAAQRESLAAETLRLARALEAEGRVDAADVAAREAELAAARQGRASAEHEWRLARLERLALLGALPGGTAAPDSGASTR